MKSLAELGVSVVIPTLNVADTLPATLAALGEAEVIIADGGSTDDTLAVAAAATVVTSPRGRGPQLAAGADAAKGDWLLFLHADTRPQGDWLAAVERFVGDAANIERAASFRYGLDMAGAGARRLERWVAWRSRALALPYGDQALLIGKDFYHEIGGYRAVPIMEDVDLVRRIGRARLVMLDAVMLTSGRRYRRSGLARRGLRNLACLGLYYLGLPPRLIARLYG